MGKKDHWTRHDHRHCVDGTMAVHHLRRGLGTTLNYPSTISFTKTRMIIAIEVALVLDDDDDNDNDLELPLFSHAEKYIRCKIARFHQWEYGVWFKKMKISSTERRVLFISAMLSISY